MPFMIAHGASVVIVRDGKRKTIPANTGADFTEEEIASVNRAAPGALRKPVNEGRSEADAETPKGKKAAPTKQEAPATTETAAQKKKRLAAEKKAAEAAAAAADDDDDDAGDDDAGDEDEDI